MGTDGMATDFQNIMDGEMRYAGEDTFSAVPFLGGGVNLAGVHHPDAPKFEGELEDYYHDVHLDLKLDRYAGMDTRSMVPLSGGGDIGYEIPQAKVIVDNIMQTEAQRAFAAPHKHVNNGRGGWQPKNRRPERGSFFFFAGARRRRPPRAAADARCSIGKLSTSACPYKLVPSDRVQAPLGRARRCGQRS